MKLSVVRSKGGGMERPELENWFRKTDEQLLAEEQKLEEMKHFLGQLSVEETEQVKYEHLIVPDIAGRDL